MKKKKNKQEISIHVSNKVTKQIEQKVIDSSSAIWFVETENEDTNI